MLLSEAHIRNAFKHVEARYDSQCEGRYNTEKKKNVHSSIKSNNYNLIGSFIKNKQCDRAYFDINDITSAISRQPSPKVEEELR